MELLKLSIIFAPEKNNKAITSNINNSFLIAYIRMKRIVILLAWMMLCSISAQAQWWYDDINYPPYDRTVKVDSTNFPLVFITVNGEEISRYDKILGHMTVIANHNDSLNYADTIKHPGQRIDFDGPISIKYRGNTSFGSDWENTKKPMNVRTLREASLDSKKAKVSLAGLDKDNNWTFLAPWQDISYIRDVLTMQLAQGGEVFTPEMRYCEVFIDNIYYGIYILSERATKGKNRLNLWDVGQDDNGNAIDDLTGDFSVEVGRREGTYYTSRYRPVYSNGSKIQGKYITYQYKDPDEADFDSLPAGTRSAINHEINQMEAAFASNDYTNEQTGYRKYIDVTSFIDYEIAQEVGNNIDGYRLSTPMYKYSKTHAEKTRDNDLWKMCLWDFNIAYGHSFGSYYSPSRREWRYTANDIMCDWDSDDEQLIPFYWYKLMKDSAYIRDVQVRYSERRKTNYSNNNIAQIVDSLENLLNSQHAVDRDNQAWGYHFDNWEYDILDVKYFTLDRLAWMDQQWFVEASASIMAPESEGDEIEGIYDINGHRLASPRKGINIIRMRDGSSRKLLVK